MYNEAQGNNSYLRYQQQYKIQSYHRVGVQRMKTNTAAVWVINRVCQQVIKIYQHSGA